MNLLLGNSLFLKIKPYKSLVVLTGIALAGGIFAFPLSYVAKSNLLVGLCLLPFSVFFHGKQRVNYFYLFLIVFLAWLAYAYNVRIFYFFSLAVYILFLLEYSIGKASHLILFLLVFMSPFFDQVAVITGFPLRLQLSEWAGSLLTLAGMDVHVEGNMMSLNGTAFTVDDACMGLHLLSISLLMGVFIIGHRCRITKHQLPFVHLTAFFLHVFLLNVVSNLFRIVVLVAFRVLPENPMHDVIGIMCLVFYVMIPLYILSGWMVHRFGKPFCLKKDLSPLPLSGKMGAAAITVAMLMLWLGSQMQHARSESNLSHASVTFENYTPVRLDGGVTKMSDEKILVYIKPIPEFFTGEHTPLICWKGSGYHFGQIGKREIKGTQVFTGHLVKAGSQLYTAWWYDNGKVKTIDQFDWRMRMLKGEGDFCLVNVTTEDEATLYAKLESIFEDNLLTIRW